VRVTIAAKMRLALGIAVLASVLGCSASTTPHTAAPRAIAEPASDTGVLTLTADTELDPARTYGPIVIARRGITVEGRGAWVVGATTGAPRDFTGVGIAARDVSDVTLRNVNVKGFRIGLQVEGGANWTIEDCDVSDNFHDPDFDWGEQPPGGGIVLTNVRGGLVRRNRAQHNWNGCSLRDCTGLVLMGNDFSHASNTCLSLWHSSANQVMSNNLSWGLRIRPGETHARDSTGVLIESGSDYNLFLENDVTHGGDGIFIRVLNNWTSTGNWFADNDCSFANNNAFEAWSPGNVFQGNKANHSSYGFWLGASEETTLLGNEAAWNGSPDGFHNAPEAFGHGGIVFVNGPSNHTTVEENHCHDNAGGGIVLRGDLATEGRAWRAFHWVIQENVLEQNRWGIYVQHADWIDIGPNSFRDNRDADVFDAGDVTNLFRRDTPGPARAAPIVRIETDAAGPWRAGERVRLRAIGPAAPQAKLHFRWDLGDGTVAEGTAVEHAFTTAGFYPVGVTVDDGRRAGLAHLDVLVHDGLHELGTERASEGDAAPQWTQDAGGASRVRAEAWDGQDMQADTVTVTPVVGSSCVHARIDPYDGNRVALLWPATRDAGQPLTDASTLIVWLRARNPNLPAWQDVNPVITVFEDEQHWLRFTPARDLLANPPHLYGRDGWNRFAVPLAGDELWKREGPGLRTLSWLTIGLDSWGWEPFDVWIDGLSVR
jgi:parallel beta-helix repeat protein